ncbi:MAG: helix-turn-helix transcriptional regulator [Acidobacteriota bacterium]
MWPHPDALTSDLSKKTFEHPLLEQYWEEEKPDLSTLSREIRELATFIFGNLFEPGLNVKTARRRCRIRDNNISSRFRRAMGKGIKEYIDDHRMAAAAILLRRTELSIFDIAMSVGFHHVETFYQVFRRRYGCTPGRFRSSPVLEEVPS